MQQNCWNRQKQKTCTSGVPGVKKQGNRWISTINVNKKELHLGSFVDFNEAVKVRKNAEQEYYQEYSFDNSMKIAESFPELNQVGG